MALDCPICLAPHRWFGLRKRIPTVKLLVSRLGVDIDVARRMRHIMQNCAGYHTVMERLDEAMETHGVEQIAGRLAGREISFDYLNTGDTYNATIVRNINDNFVVSSWGYQVETLERRGARFP